ncbi:unnamed protein product, partial [Vitis vinifera]
MSDPLLTKFLHELFHCCLPKLISRDVGWLHLACQCALGLPVEVSFCHKVRVAGITRMIASTWLCLECWSIESK